MLDWFGGNNEKHRGDDDENENARPITTPILVEIVSARDLNVLHRATIFDKEVDPYCIVKFNSSQETLHTTSTIWNDDDPIWTVKTKSLCLVDVPIEKDEGESEEEEDSIVVQVCHGKACLGVVTVPFSQVLEETGERKEYPVLAVQGETTNEASQQAAKIQPMLAMRFRKATPQDLEYFGRVPQVCGRGLLPPKATEASDINLQNIQERKLLQSYVKREANSEVKYRVQPYPDPASPSTTTWMTQQQVYEEALKPSKKWVEAGTGDIGKVFVEIISCDDLVNLDMGVGDYTDPFVGIVFEDSMVRTDVIHDALDPRWMPWCTRAFCFNIVHPSSILMVGVFDYDVATEHDPVGRVVINMANFQSDTEYLLHYALHDDPNQQDDRGTIMIRLRVEWKSESKARKLAFRLPPRFLINVDNPRAFGVLRYICRGRVNMEQASLESVKYYANELMSYGLVYCYLIDVVIGVLLWRGRANLWLGCTTVNVWFPIHSIALLTAAVVALEFPTMIPAVICFGAAYMMLAMNYYGSHYPYPWNRCKSWQETNKLLVLGRCVHPPIHIEPDTGVEEAQALETLDKIKAQRVSRFLWDVKTVGLRVRKVYSKTKVKSHAIDTEEEEGWFAGSLYYVHMALMYLCTYLRLWRRFVNWKGYYAHKFTLWCLIFGFMWVFLPMNTVMQWIARVVVWTLLGPWMKLVDILYIHPRYRTTEEILADPTVKDTHLETLLQSDSVRNMGTSARLASEEALKLKDMREEKFGKLSQLVPPVDMSRHASIPLPDSTAHPYSPPPEKEEELWECASSQMLEGEMLPLPKQQASSVLFEI